MYNEIMTYPITPKWAVYFGTIRLKDGTLQTFTADDVATLYGVDGEDYLPVDMSDPEPFSNGRDYMSYYHLKPLANDHDYFNAIDRYNTTGAIQWDEDFDARQGGKWAVRTKHQSDQNIG